MALYDPKPLDPLLPGYTDAEISWSLEEPCDWTMIQEVLDAYVELRKLYLLNEIQHKGEVHPYTCGNNSRHAPLIAFVNGWLCLDCDYTQPF